MIYDRNFTMLFNLLIINMANMHTRKLFLKNLGEWRKNGIFTRVGKFIYGFYSDGRTCFSRTFTVWRSCGR